MRVPQGVRRYGTDRSVLVERIDMAIPLKELFMEPKREMPEVQYDDTKVGKRLREQARRKIQDENRKNGEFARGEKRQGDGV